MMKIRCIPPTAAEKTNKKNQKGVSPELRKNEYTSLEEFRSQYIGVWAPSEGHWLGLDFSYKGTEYRFQTWPMYKAEATILPDGRTAVYGLYRKNVGKKPSREYSLLEEFATMDDVLLSTCIGEKPFSEVIMDDDTELLGQD
jgi:hypothetical protein